MFVYLVTNLSTLGALVANPSQSYLRFLYRAEIVTSAEMVCPPQYSAYGILCTVLIYSRLKAYGLCLYLLFPDYK